MLGTGTRFTRYGAIALAAICLTLPAPAQDWKTYNYPADGFSAAYPAEPEVTKKDVPTSAGAFELRSYMTRDNDVALYIGVCDYGTAISGADPDKQLQGAKNGALTNSSSHLIREKKIALGGYPGVEFESESATAHFYSHIYMVGATLYQILVIAPVGKPYEDTLKFLDSFQLIARVRG